MKVILGIESSHDDTSIAIIENLEVKVFLKISQIDIHKVYGGTVPEIASREHYNNFYILLEQLKQQYDLNKIDCVAYTEKPGLIGSLQMGTIFAHALSKILNKPLKPIDHLHGHIFSVLLDNQNKILYPAIALVVSGGHTNLYLLKNKSNIELIGKTVDDAVGEVYDKVSRILFNEFPGGPKIDLIFNEHKEQNLNQYSFRQPKLDNEFNFSFSGYKTQILNYKNKLKSNDYKLLAASFQKSIVDFIISKVKIAINSFNPKTIILSGGVSANSYLREQFQSIHNNPLMPQLKYATDNGAMIAAAAFVEESND